MEKDLRQNKINLSNHEHIFLIFSNYEIQSPPYEPNYTLSPLSVENDPIVAPIEENFEYSGELEDVDVRKKNPRRQTSGFYVGSPGVFTEAVGVPDIWTQFTDQWGARTNKRKRVY